MKILITGVNGIIGSEVYKSLVKNNEVLGIGSSNKSDVCGNYTKVDISDDKAVEEYLKDNSDIEVIIHSAALAHNKGTDRSFDGFKKVNFNGTKNLVDYANKYLKSIKKFIFFSTISVYGERMEKNIYCEEDQCYPKSPYAITKKMSEDYLSSTAKFNYTVLRFAPVYSENFTLNINRRTKLKNIFYTVAGGRYKLSLCNMKNIIEVCNYFINNIKVGNKEIYNISDGIEYRYNDLVEKHRATRLNIPRIFVYCIYLINKVLKSQFIQENSIKLISDNIYTSQKISKLVYINYNLLNMRNE